MVTCRSPLQSPAQTKAGVSVAVGIGGLGDVSGGVWLAVTGGVAVDVIVGVTV
jgi:hypothetical protein